MSTKISARHLLALAFVSLAACVCSQQAVKIDEEFYNDLASENNRVASVLFLDVYNGNLDTLTYEAYLDYLGAHEAVSAEGLTATIRESDEHLFESNKDAFLMILLYRDARKIVGDKSNTSRIDTVLILDEGLAWPPLSELAASMRF